MLFTGLKFGFGAWQGMFSPMVGNRLLLKVCGVGLVLLIGG
jgi:hypothetical protein